MATDRKERLSRAAAEAAVNMGKARESAAGRSGPAAPGDLYVFPVSESAALEWLVIRAHPDDPGLLLLVPGDDFPLAGTADVPLPPDPTRRRLIARCGQGLWAPTTLLDARRRVGCLPVDQLPQVRQMLADLARGRNTGGEQQQQADADPEYEDWMEVVEGARKRLQGFADHSRPVYVLSTSPSQALAAEPQFALAAETGDELAAGMERAATRVNAGLISYEFPLPEGGKLSFLVHEHGMSVAWDGPGAPPALCVEQEAGRPILAEWQKGTEDKFYRSDFVFQWSAGEVLISVDAPSPFTLIAKR
jgi:hypothetical protein